MAINPYTGNRNNLPKSIPIPDGAQRPLAATVMAPAQANRDSVLYLNDRIQSVRARNWQTIQNWNATGTAGPHAARWDDVGKRWILAGLASGPLVNVFVYDGQGESLPPLSGSSPPLVTPATSIAVDAAGDIVLVSANSPTAGQFHVAAMPGGSTTWQSSAPGIFGASFIADVKVTAWANKIVYAVGHNSSFAALNLGTISLSPIVVGGQFGAANPSGWILKNNGTYALAITKSLGAAALAYTSLDGVSWTAGAASLAGAIGSGEVPTDVAWNPYQGLWALATLDGVTHTRWYTSPDGQTWTFTGTLFTNTAFPVVSVTATQESWAAAIYNSATFQSKVVHSLDAVSWYLTQGQITGAQAVAPQIHASPTQLLLANAGPVSDTTHANGYRFSLDVGLSSGVFS